MLAEILRDIFNRFNIRDETLLLKSDNAPQQYKNRYFFAKVQGLPDDYNVKIVYAYGASGHGKGLVDSMSSFGVKNILRRGIVGNDDWWKNSEDPRMLYCHIPACESNETRKKMPELILDQCTKMHLFVYTPGSSRSTMKPYLCDCESCLAFEFCACKKEGNQDEKDIDNQKEIDNPDEEDDCELDSQNLDVDIPDDDSPVIRSFKGIPNVCESVAYGF